MKSASLLSQVQRRLFAWGMAQANNADDHSIRVLDNENHDTLADMKRSLLGNLQGRVLEIGPGAGANLKYYPNDIEWIGVEPNPFMHDYLQTEAERQGLQSVNLQEGTAEQLPVGDGSMDVVVSTHVLCSVRDPERVMAEICRVLKPGGRFVFLEHVAAHPTTWKRTLQNAVEPIWKAAFDNCHPNRETGNVLEQAGFRNLSYETFRLAFPVVSPHIAGSAECS
jgi:ubiquinone/menaquinone biosynthesis C-methylase UbiE